jgi:hypothetical protein
MAIINHWGNIIALHHQHLKTTCIVLTALTITPLMKGDAGADYLCVTQDIVCRLDHIDDINSCSTVLKMTGFFQPCRQPALRGDANHPD